MAGTGWAFAIAGVGLGLFGLFFDTSVYTDAGAISAVNNLGLMADRLMIVLIAGFLFVSGTVLIASASLRSSLGGRTRDEGNSSPPVKAGYSVGPKV